MEMTSTACPTPAAWTLTWAGFISPPRRPAPLVIAPGARSSRRALASMAMDEEDISIRELARGNSREWARAYPLLYPKVLWLAKACHPARAGADPEDVACEVISELMRKLAAGDPPSFANLKTMGDLIGMALTMTRRRSIDADRRAKRRPEESLPEGWEQFIGSTEAEPGMREIWRYVDKLGPPRPVLFHARFVLGMSSQEIADAYAMPIGTVCAHFARGLKELRKMMEEDEGREGRP